MNYKKIHFRQKNELLSYRGLAVGPRWIFLAQPVGLACILALPVVAQIQGMM
jgi:hypothetical protein